MDEHAAAAAGNHEIESLKKEMKEWALGLRCVFVVLNILPLYYCTRMLLAAPRFETILVDMMGSLDRLPGLSVIVMRHCMEILLGVWLLAGLSIVLIFVLKRARFVWIIALLSVFFFTVCGHLIALLFMDPLIGVIQGLSGGGQ